MGPGLEGQHHYLNDVVLVCLLICSVQATGTSSFSLETARRLACEHKHLVCRLLSHLKHHQPVILSDDRVLTTPPLTNDVRQTLSQNLSFSV